MTTKKIFIYGIAFILIALILVIGSILPCYLDKEFEVSGISYSTTGIIKNSVEVIDLDIASGDTVVIPESVTNEGKVYTVKGFGDGWFDESDITSITTIPCSVTYIRKEEDKKVYEITSSGGVKKIVYRWYGALSPSIGDHQTLSEFGDTIVEYALNKDPEAWKNLYTSDFLLAVTDVERKFFSNKNDMDMGCYRLFLDYLLRTTYINQRVTDISMKSHHFYTKTQGNIILEYTWEDDDIEESIYHKQLRTFCMRKEQGKWLIDNIVIEGESSKDFFKDVINYEVFC